MNLSARNQLVGTVEAVEPGAVNGVVVIAFGEQKAKADVTMEAINELGLARGVRAAVVIKATNVILAAGSERIPNISARNQFAGTVEDVLRGAVNSMVTVKLPDGNTIKGTVTNDAIEELGLGAGAPAVAVVKSTDVMVATL